MTGRKTPEGESLWRTQWRLIIEAMFEPPAQQKRLSPARLTVVLALIGCIFAGAAWWLFDNLFSDPPSLEETVLSSFIVIAMAGVIVLVPISRFPRFQVTNGVTPRAWYLLYAAAGFYMAATFALLWLPDWVGLIDLSSSSSPRVRAVPVAGLFWTVTMAGGAIYYLRKARHARSLSNEKL